MTRRNGHDPVPYWVFGSVIVVWLGLIILNRVGVLS